MASKRRTLRLMPHEDEVLRTLYRDFNIPTDQYPQRPDDLSRLVADWSMLTGRQDSSTDVLHYMITCRKNGGWVKLGRDAGSDFVRPEIQLSEDDLAHLDAIHEELQIASDNFALDSEKASRLQQEFAKRTGKIFPPMMLAAVMITRRKGGALATLKPKSTEHDLGFSDIDQVAT